VKGNFPRILLALNELKSLSRSVLARKTSGGDCILDGVKESLAQFSRMSHLSKQVGVVMGTRGTADIGEPQPLFLHVLTRASYFSTMLTLSGKK